MPQTGKVFRVLTWVIAGLSAIVLIPAAAIRVDQYLLRRDAERLLADLKSLELRKSTYHDARKVIDRWKIIHQEGPCEPNRCEVEIGVGSFFDHHQEFFIHHQKLTQVWRILGGRAAEIDGYIRVRRDVVWGKGIRAIVLSYSTRYQDDINLGGRMGTGSPGFISPLHPEYDVGIGRHTTGAFSAGAYADFTPYADPADVRRLMDIDFSCLTRWHSCQTGADIAPAAWKEATAESEKRAARNSAELICNPGIIRVLARESRRAVIGEVSRIELYPESFGDSSFANVKILLKDDLKHNNFSFLAALKDYSFNEPVPVKEKIGERYILFYRYPDGPYLDEDRACALLPATEENLEDVGRGVAEDW
ncbi:MAG: hypothetical protein WCA76_00940 [Candidatus Sulfotelmatobacter sp.]|jgi:hypothetical protein